MTDADHAALALTRKSLIARLKNWDDQLKWQEFFETYWRLIYVTARRAGLREDEGQEVVQETCITVAKNIASYDPEKGAFKAWLLNTARWKINDQFRRRKKAAPARGAGGDSVRTTMIERIPSGEKSIEQVWEEEWQSNLLDAALARLKRKVDAKQFQIFQCVAVKGWTTSETAERLNVSATRVYLVKHRLKALLKKEFRALEA